MHGQSCINTLWSIFDAPLCYLFRYYQKLIWRNFVALFLQIGFLSLLVELCALPDSKGNLAPTAEHNRWHAGRTLLLFLIKLDTRQRFNIILAHSRSFNSTGILSPRHRLRRNKGFIYVQLRRRFRPLVCFRTKGISNISKPALSCPSVRYSAAALAQLYSRFRPVSPVQEYPGAQRF